MTCLMHAFYSMEADVYSQTVSQHESGQYTRTWSHTNPTVIACEAAGVLGGGIRVVGSTEWFRDQYENVDWVKMRTGAKLTKRQRVGNIRNGAGPIWVDEDNTPIEFDVLGVQPVTDMFGNVLEWDVLLKRVQNP